MNETPEIVPHKITKPIQLLAAWLPGLAIVNASFLTAAGLLHVAGQSIRGTAYRPVILTMINNQSDPRHIYRPNHTLPLPISSFRFTVCVSSSCRNA